VEITTDTDTKTTYIVPLPHWKSAVLKFSSQVLEFYDTSPVKEYSQAGEEIAANHPILISEWRQRLHDLQNT